MDWKVRGSLVPPAIDGLTKTKEFIPSYFFENQITDKGYRNSDLKNRSV